ncbi:hypothetical protein EGX94_09125 [Propionibacterium acidifaciens]|nr:hypothetical protein EGX94_09125 [Propionibacterium acidifaciens]
MASPRTAPAVEADEPSRQDRPRPATPPSSGPRRPRPRTLPRAEHPPPAPPGARAGAAADQSSPGRGVSARACS